MAVTMGFSIENLIYPYIQGKLAYKIFYPWKWTIPQIGILHVFFGNFWRFLAKNWKNPLFRHIPVTNVRSCHQKDHPMALHVPIYVFITCGRLRNAIGCDLITKPKNGLIKRRSKAVYHRNGVRLALVINGCNNGIFNWKSYISLYTRETCI